MRQKISISTMVMIATAAIVFVGCATADAEALQTATATPAATATTMHTTAKPLPAEIQLLLDAERYKHSYWALLVADVETGEVLYELNADKLMVPGSTAKLFSTAAALNALGATYTFTTPVYATGVISPEGTLTGDLVLVASGDLTLGGRTTADNKIEFTNADHGDANALPQVELTQTDPLAGLDNLAEQIAATIKTVNGNVVIDDRLYETLKVNEGTLSPITINENLVDVIVTPTVISATAQVSSRPETAAFKITNEVVTVANGEPTAIKVTSPSAGVLVVTGQLAVDAQPAIRVYDVGDPAEFARTLFIEALERAGVSVNAAAVGSNPTDELPTNYSGAEKVAELVSPPFSENIKLTNKVSQNYDANSMPILLAMKNGKTDYDDGFALMGEFLKSIGVNTDGVSLEDGEGGAPADYISARAEVELLSAMTTHKDFAAYKASLPILGVDGSLASAATPNSPAIGKVFAKTGTRAVGDPLNNRIIMQTKALAGYMTTASGRELAFAMFVGPTPASDIETVLAVGNDLGRITEILYEGN